MEPPRNMFDSLERTLAHHCRDHSAQSRDAWVYGIVLGWGKALGEVAEKHRWSSDDVARLRRFRRDWTRLRRERGRG